MEYWGLLPAPLNLLYIFQIYHFTPNKFMIFTVTVLYFFSFFSYEMNFVIRFRKMWNGLRNPFSIFFKNGSCDPS